MGGKLVRERWIDVLKGIAISLVVFGHAIGGFIKSGSPCSGNFEMNVYRGIYIFHMPLFMAISGYVFSLAYLELQNDRGGVKPKLTVKGKYKRQVYNLTVIYFIFSILMFGFRYIFSSYVNTSVGWQDLVKLPINYLPESPYWYLYILVLAYMLEVYFLKQDWDKRSVLYISFVACMVYSMLQFEEIITAQRIFYYFFFFMLGCSFKLRERFMPGKYYILQFVLAIVLSWLILAKENFRYETFIPLLKIFVSILVINMMFGAAKKYMNHRGILSFIGEKSLEIYTLHIFITSGIRPVLKVFHIENFWFAVAIATLLGIALPVICSYILKKMRLWDLFFKPVTFISNYRKQRLMTLSDK